MVAFARSVSEQRAASPYTGFERLPIAGQWRQGRSKSVNRDRDPYRGEILLEIPQASREDLEEAYSAAAKAQRDWGALPPGSRSEILRQVAAVMEGRREEIVSWLIREAGSTRIKANLEWETVHAIAFEAATLPYLVEGLILPADISGKESRVYRQPVGVVGVISPWNWPLHLSARSVFPALAVGNAVVLKPASDTPVTGGLLLAKLLEEAGLPAGVLSVIVGSGGEIGDAFVSHPIPRVISFTGSTPVGRHIGRLAMESPIIKRLELELGGNTPFVVLEDADLDYALEAAVFGKFLHQGQICMSTNRFIIADAVYEPFVEGLAGRVRSLKVGDPDDPETLIGPIINGSQFDKLSQRIEEARQSGFKLVAGAEPERDKLLLPPHLFSEVDNDHPFAQEELFGPVAPMIRARDAEHALELANNTTYGLSSSVFTGNTLRGVEFAKRMEAGMSHVNDQPVNDLPFNPFGGEKNSGIGRFNGRWAVHAFTTDHWITVQHQPRKFPANAEEAHGPWGGG